MMFDAKWIDWRRHLSPIKLEDRTYPHVGTEHLKPPFPFHAISLDIHSSRTQLSSFGKQPVPERW